MKRISVTTLEKFRRYMAETSSFDTEESLIESLKGLFKGNDKTKFGSACHKIVEGEYIGHEGEVAVVIDNEVFVFNKQQYTPFLDYRIAHPLMIHEMPVQKVYETAYGPIQVTGRIDGIEGRVVRDLKNRFRALSDSDYTDSCQWKFYLEMLGLDLFYYDVFEIKGFSILLGSPHKTSVEVIQHEPIPCNSYAGMKEDNLTLLNDFMGYIHNRNFIHLLKPALKQNGDNLIF